MVSAPALKQGLAVANPALWTARRFVEEQDRLALALDGRFTRRPMGLRCKAPSPQQPAEQGEPGELGIVGRQPGALGRKAQ